MSFRQHAEAHGLILNEVIADGRWHRTSTTDKRKSKKNGAYLFDGVRGVVRNWATMQDYAAYREDGSTSRVDQKAIRELQRRQARERIDQQIKARQIAADMIQRATLAPHPYLATKGFPKEMGLVLEDELLIPMRDIDRYKTLNSLQRIKADGTKLFLSGGKAKGSVFLLGPVGQERWLVEGYATALSVKAALDELRRKAQIVVCFSCGNLDYVAKMVRRPAYVFADHDGPSQAGQLAATRSGLPWTMSPEPDMDANDFHKKFGLRALVGLIREVDRG